MELAAKTMGRLALVSGSKASEYVEFEVKRAFEWLGATDRNEVSILYPSYFQFFVYRKGNSEIAEVIYFFTNYVIFYTAIAV